jgi:hypothetical protein
MCVARGAGGRSVLAKGRAKLLLQHTREAAVSAAE